MEKLKKFEATYKKQFEAETEDAIYIAKISEPSGIELDNVVEVSESNLHPIFEDICECFNPIKNAKLLKECEIKANKI